MSQMPAEIQEFSTPSLNEVCLRKLYTSWKEDCAVPRRILDALSSAERLCDHCQKVAFVLRTRFIFIE